MAAQYVISVQDEWEWIERGTTSLMGLRKYLRELEAEGWERSVSILVERVDRFRQRELFSEAQTTPDPRPAPQTP